MASGMLSFDQVPPLAAPLRFFVTAPLFIALAGLLAVIDGPAILASRWTPAALAATHLLTVGFMLQVMLGALIQVLPVVAGAALARPLWVARVVHPAINLGALALAGGFLWSAPGWLHAAGTLLALALLVFVVAAGSALFRVPSTSPSIRGIKLSLAGLAVVGGSGLFMLLALAGGWSLPLLALADLHAAWGLAGWAGMLLAAVAYVVVPMFQLTPGYAARPAWGFPVFLFAVLLAWSAALAFDADWPARLGRLLLAAGGAAFAVQTLRLQAKRRRARPDTTFRYWQFGLYGALLALAILAAGALVPALADDPRWTPAFGLVLLLGAFVPLIVGMLAKIVPFLLWLDLQNHGLVGKALPPMNKLLPEAPMQRQFQVFVAAAGLALLAVLLPDWLSRPAGVLLIAAAVWLAVNLLQASWRHGRQLQQAPA